MMYTEYKLPHTSFKMVREKYNELVNSINENPTEESVPVRVGLTIRTMKTNRIAYVGESVLFDIEINPHNNKGYFSVIHSIRHFLLDTYGEKILPLIPKTVLMPVGAFMYNNEMILYFNLILEDEVENEFITDNIKMQNLSNLGYLDEKSKIIKPTLTFTTH